MHPYSRFIKQCLEKKERERERLGLRTIIIIADLDQLCVS